MEELIRKITKMINKLRNIYGQDICTDPIIDGDIIRYVFMPDDITGYKVEINYENMTTRHCGLGRGCFWTEWVSLQI